MRFTFIDNIRITINIESMDSNKETIRKLYEECLNPGKLELLGQFISPDYEGIYGTKGPDGYREIISQLKQGFPDIKWTVEDLLAEGNKVVIRWTWHGTNTGSLMGLAPSNKPVDDFGIVIYELEDGLITRAWVQTDRLGILQQIGAVSAGIMSTLKGPTHRDE